MLLITKKDGKQVRQEMEQPEKIKKYDMIVTGMGTAGIFAALAASEKRLAVLGLEKMNCCGGTGTAGGVHGYYFGNSGGLYERLDEAVREMEKNGYVSATGLNPEVKKYVCEQVLVEKHVEVHYESMVTGVLMEGSRVCGIRWLENGQTHMALAEITVDCTGDAGICDMIGCQVQMGRPFDGQVQPFSIVQPELKNGVNEFWHYTDCGYIDALDAEQYSRACVSAACLKNYDLEDYSERRILGMAPLLGVREGRRVEADETVTLKDYLEDRFMDHPAFYAYSNLDNHGRDLAFESETLQDWIVAASLWGINISVPIPIGCCIPKNFDGIMTAGRNISVDHEIASCVRQRRDMQKCGEAVGCLAALAVRQKKSIRDIPYEELKEELLKTGCLKKEDRVGSWELDGEEWKRADWLTDVEEIRRGLSSKKPGIAIWSAKRLGKAAEPQLEAWLEEPDQNIARNTALALGLLKNASALPLLRQMAEEQDPSGHETSRKYNQPRGLSAVYLLGKMMDVEAVDILGSMVAEPETIRSKGHTYDVFIRGEEEYRFQYFTHASMALMKIMRTHPQLREKVSGILEKGMSSSYFQGLLSDMREEHIYARTDAEKMQSLWQKRQPV